MTRPSSWSLDLLILTLVSMHVREVLVDASADSLDIYRAFPYIIYGQLISLLTSLKVQNRPDTPSPTGTVNRVVQGVIIHPFHKE